MYHHHIRSRIARRAALPLLCACLLPLAASGLRAQGWQVTYGTSSESGRAAVETANGDIVAACGNGADATLLRINAFGNCILPTFYPFNNYRSSAASAIREYPNGDLILVGSALDFNGQQSAFAMRTTGIGVPVWITMLGDPSQHIFATDVVVAQQGDGITTHAGDVVLCGRDHGLFMGPRGMLARLDANGSLIWYKSYYIPIVGGGSNEDIESLDEVQVATGIGNVGDIVTVGSMASAVAGADVPYDMWLMRVDGVTGSATGPGLGVAIYGTPGNDLGHDIKELRYGPNAGDLIVAAESDLTLPASGPRQVVVLQTSPDPCGPTADAVFSDLSNQNLSATALCEIPPAAGGNTGDIVLAGLRDNGPLGARDVLSQELRPTTLLPVGVFHYYGGTADDYATSISPVVNGPTSNGYVLAGWTNSPDLISAGSTQNIYLLKNFLTLTNNCHYRIGQTSVTPANLTVQCVTPIESNVVTVANPGSSPACPPWIGNQACDPDSKRAIGQAGHVDAGIADLDAFPTPTRRGDAFTIAYTLNTATSARITVTDAAGRTVHETSGERPQGRVTELIQTAGWSVGAYMVTVRAGGHATTTRVLVAEP